MVATKCRVAILIFVFAETHISTNQSGNKNYARRSIHLLLYYRKYHMYQPVPVATTIVGFAETRKRIDQLSKFTCEVLPILILLENIIFVHQHALPY